MSSVNFWRVYLLLVVTACLSMPAWTKNQVIGSAYDSVSGEFLYSELHDCTENNEICSVEYRDILGELIATKKLDFSTSPYRPALAMRDYRSDVRQEISAQTSEGLVVDAGFDNFIRSRWSALVSGESVQFSFLVVGREDPLDMYARLDDSTPCPDQELCLLISLDSWFLDLLVDPVGLAYSRKDRTLLRYEGPSNIRGAQGESLQVVIHYQYGEGLLPPEKQSRQEATRYSLLKRPGKAS